MHVEKIVILTCDPRMGRNSDRGILRDNEAWAEQVVARRRRPGEHDAPEYIHQQAVSEGRGDAGIRRGMVTAFRAAATAAGKYGAIFLMVGHGSDQMVDLAPAPLLRVTENTIHAARNVETNRRIRSETGPLSYDDETETLLALRDAIVGRFYRLDLGTCNVGRDRGPDLCGRLQRFFDIPSVRGLEGFLWSSRVLPSSLRDGHHSGAGRSVVGVGVTSHRGAEPDRLYGYEIPPNIRWAGGRANHGPEALPP